MSRQYNFLTVNWYIFLISLFENRRVLAGRSWLLRPRRRWNVFRLKRRRKTSEIRRLWISHPWRILSKTVTFNGNIIMCTTPSESCSSTMDQNDEPHSKIYGNVLPEIKHGLWAPVYNNTALWVINVAGYFSNGPRAAQCPWGWKRFRKIKMECAHVTAIFDLEFRCDVTNCNIFLFRVI